MLKSLSIIVDLSPFSFGSVRFYFIYFATHYKKKTEGQNGEALLLAV